MEYLVIELKPRIRITTLDGEPIIYKDKNSAFKASDKCIQGLVYPIVDIMKVFEQIKNLSKKSVGENNTEHDLLDELFAITNEII